MQTHRYIVIHTYTEIHADTCRDMEIHADTQIYIYL